MNIANITAKFSAFSGLSGDELSEQSTVINTAAEYIEAHTVPGAPNAEQVKKLETLCAAYAYKLYDMCNDSGITSFTAGDVKLTSPNGGKGSGERVWQEFREIYGGLLRGDGFIFGRM